MKGPTRPAPALPRPKVNRYSPVTNWNDDPFEANSAFGADVFEPNPHNVQKKKPPPRPPPPKVNSRPDPPNKPSYFQRKPTVLSSLLTRKSKGSVLSVSGSANINVLAETNREIDTSKIFPKCEPKQIQTGTLIDLSSPPSSPTFTTRSSSDGLSVDSFGSDATNSTNNHNTLNGGNSSQAESGFEDDFEMFMHSRKTISKEDTLNDFNSLDSLRTCSMINKPPIMKKPVQSKDHFDVIKHNCHTQMKGPTIIRAKPVRPKPPDNISVLKNSFGNSLPIMNVNTTVPIHQVSNGVEDYVYSTESIWNGDSSPDRESPPMPVIPPPPPPIVTDDDLILPWPEDSSLIFETNVLEDEEPYAVALFDYYTDHPEDLSFLANTKITLIKRVNEEWLFGKVRSGLEGLFPTSYVDIKVPLPNEKLSPSPCLGIARVLYDLEPEQPGDLRLCIGDNVKVMRKINEEWYYGENNGMQGQFPSNYVQIC